MADLKDDIEKYLHGGLSESEMHALERKALSDPFLADALMGAESVQNEDFSADMKDIRASLNKRIAETDKVPVWLWIARIAAGLLILIVTGYVIYHLANQSGTVPTLALNKQESEAKQDVKHNDDKDSISVVQPHAITEGHDEVSNAKPSKSKSSPSVETIVEKPQDISLGGQSEMSLENEQKEVEEVTEFKREQEPTAQTSPAPKPASPEMEQYKSRTPSTVKLKKVVTDAMTEDADKSRLRIAKVVRGKVTDSEDGSPLPGVNVLIKDSNEGTVTNAEGDYQLYLDNLDTTLVFSFIGLQNTEVPLEDRENVDVKMSQDISQLSEVVVVGYSSPLDEVGKEKDAFSYSLADPAGGRKAFKKYLLESMKYPKLAIENKVEGKVTVQFTVGVSGELSNFKVIKGIGYGCDEEVIRLVRNGPKWTPTKRNEVPLRAKAKVRVRFALPD